MSILGYIVTIRKDKKYIKRTSKFGAFHGSIVTTANRAEARIWTREKDARRAAHTYNWRTYTYPRDKEKHGTALASVLDA